MDLNFDPLFQCWGEFNFINKNVYTPAEHFKNSSHNSKKEIKIQVQSKVVTFLYVGTCLWTRYIHSVWWSAHTFHKKKMTQSDFPTSRFFFIFYYVNLDRSWAEV